MVLIPCGDQEMRLVSQNHSELCSEFRIATPPWDIIQWAYDKRLTYDRAESAGIHLEASTHRKPPYASTTTYSCSTVTAKVSARYGPSTKLRPGSIPTS